MAENKSSIYEKYRDYFTCQTEEATHPGNGIFVLIREGFVSWLTQDGPPLPSPGEFPGRCLREEGECGELVNLLATIAMEVQKNGI